MGRLWARLLRMEVQTRWGGASAMRWWAISSTPMLRRRRIRQSRISTIKCSCECCDDWWDWWELSWMDGRGLRCGTGGGFAGGICWISRRCWVKQGARLLMYGDLYLVAFVVGLGIIWILKFRFWLVLWSGRNWMEWMGVKFVWSVFFWGCVLWVVQDSFTRCFKSNAPEPWNWNIYLFPLWALGVVFRYFVLFPIRFESSTHHYSCFFLLERAEEMGRVGPAGESTWLLCDQSQYVFCVEFCWFVCWNETGLFFSHLGGLFFWACSFPCTWRWKTTIIQDVKLRLVELSIVSEAGFNAFEVCDLSLLSKWP